MNSEDISPKYFIADYEDFTGDKRLDRRLQQLSQNLSLTPGSNISQLSDSRSEQVAYYRLLENDKLTEEALITEHTSRMEKLCEDRDLLVLMDTCEVNLSKNKNRIKPGSGIGQSANSENATCFKFHPGLVLNESDFNVLGFSGIKVFHTQPGLNRHQRNYKRTPIQEKESYKWIDVCLQSKKTLSKANRVTFIQDREGDIFEQFALVPEKQYHLLVRSRTTRKTSDELDLYAAMEELPLAGTYTIEIEEDKRHKRKKRTAQMAICYGKFSIKRPGNLKVNDYPEYIEVYGVWAQEVTPGVAEEDLIDWKLLTTHTLDNVDDALKMMAWYKARWYIEQLFRLLKKQGFGIEEARLETGWAIRKLVLIQLSSLLKIIQMNIAYSSPEGGQPIEEVFNEQEIEVLRQVEKRLQGNTKKTKNNNDPVRTKWATWIIGRLGGWKGYESQGPPGVICLKRGLDRFYGIFEGIQIAKDMCTG